MGIIAIKPEESAKDSHLMRLLELYPFAADLWPGALPKDMAPNLKEELASCQAAWALPGEKGGYSWAAGVKTLEFDSRIFGRPMARLYPLVHAMPWPQPGIEDYGRGVIDAAATWGQSRGIECLVGRVPCRDYLGAHALETVGSRMADISVEWMKDLSQGWPEIEADPEVSIRPAAPDDEEWVIACAANALCDLAAYADRFALDERLRPRCPEMYSQWLKNSFSGQMADQILVLEFRGEEAGFITLKLPRGATGPAADCGYVEINAIRPAFRGRGLYNILLASGLSWLRERGCKYARVRTKLSQQAVISAWGRIGARQVSADVTFYLWI